MVILTSINIYITVRRTRASYEKALINLKSQSKNGDIIKENKRNRKLAEFDNTKGRVSVRK